MKISVSLVTCNGAKDIRHCLQSVKQQTMTDVEVIVVDNASTDDTVAVVRDACPGATIIKNEKNLGFAIGHNQAIARSTGEFVLVLNQDAALEPDYCEKLVEFMGKNPQAGSATGTILRCESLRFALSSSKGASLTKRQGKPIVDSQGMFLKNRYFVRLFGEGESYHEGETAPKEVFGIPATVAVYRKEALGDIAIPIEGRKEVFDADFFMYKEDVDLAYRLQWRGWKSYLVPDAVCYHIRTKRGGSRSYGWINELSYRNTLLLEWKNISPELFARVWSSILSYESAKFFYSLLREPSSLLKLYDFIRLRRRMIAKREWIMSNRKASVVDILKFY